LHKQQLKHRIIKKRQGILEGTSLKRGADLSHCNTKKTGEERYNNPSPD
jgi:hypothetical protein